jgi:hypothetical protein
MNFSRNSSSCFDVRIASFNDFLTSPITVSTSPACLVFSFGSLGFCNLIFGSGELGSEITSIYAGKMTSFGVPKAEEFGVNIIFSNF